MNLKQLTFIFNQLQIHEHVFVYNVMHLKVKFHSRLSINTILHQTTVYMHFLINVQIN